MNRSPTYGSEQTHSNLLTRQRETLKAAHITSRKQQQIDMWTERSSCLSKPHHDYRVQLGSSVLNRNHRVSLSLSLSKSSWAQVLCPLQACSPPVSNLGARAGMRGETWGCGNWGASAGRGGDLLVFGTLQQGWVADTHLERSLAGQVGGAASARPSLRVQELARVVGAVTQAWTVEAWVGVVQLLGGVAFHEKVDRHHTRTLSKTETERERRRQGDKTWSWTHGFQCMRKS